MDSKRRVLVKGLGMVFLGLTPFLKACNRLGGEAHSKEEKMQTQPGTPRSSLPQKSILPIDAAAPSRIETAAFALG